MIIDVHIHYGDECYRGYAPDVMCDHAKQVFHL